MKKFVLCVFAAALTVLMLASCGAEGKVELRVYNWQDYMDPEVIEMFEEETGISVRYNVYDTNENMYNKINLSTKNLPKFLISHYKDLWVWWNCMIGQFKLAMPRKDIF